MCKEEGEYVRGREVYNEAGFKIAGAAQVLFQHACSLVLTPACSLVLTPACSLVLTPACSLVLTPACSLVLTPTLGAGEHSRMLYMLIHMQQKQYARIR